MRAIKNKRERKKKKENSLPGRTINRKSHFLPSTFIFQVISNQAQRNGRGKKNARYRVQNRKEATFFTVSDLRPFHFLFSN